jgi:hypothetical protein
MDDHKNTFVTRAELRDCLDETASEPGVDNHAGRIAARRAPWWRPSVIAWAFLEATSAGLAANAQPPPVAYSVSLHCDRSVPLKQAAMPAIQSWALRLVASSTENSTLADWYFPRSDIEPLFRDGLLGDYLRIDFASSIPITTLHGVVHVRSMVHVLRHADPDLCAKLKHCEDTLFTIDDDGAIVEHALYSGSVDFAFGRVLGRAISDSGACRHAKLLFFQDRQLPPELRDFLKKEGLQDGT